MKRTLALLLSLCLLASMTAFASAEQVKSISVYTCYVENEALQMFEQFTKDTGIKVNYVRLGAGEIVTRLEAEAQNPQASIFMGGSVDTHTSAMNKGLLDHYVSPMLDVVDDRWKDPNEVWTPVSMIVTAFTSNLDYLEEKGIPAPTSWAEVLNPALKGDVCMAHPGTSGAAYTAFSGMLQTFGVEEGFEYMKQLDANIAQYTKAGAAPYRMAGLGEIGVAIGYDLDAQATILEGYPLVITYPSEGTDYEVTCVSMVKGGPANEVEAAHAFIDWMLSDTCQTMATEQFYRYPISKTVELNPAMIPMDQLNLIDYDFIWSGDHKVELVERFEREVRTRDNVIK